MVIIRNSLKLLEKLSQIEKLIEQQEKKNQNQTSKKINS